MKYYYYKGNYYEHFFGWFDGEPGPPGAIGPSGPKGQKGETGPIGPKGLQGETGPEGPMGKRGFTGNPGPIGATGQKGDKGFQGPKGDKGDKGNPGPIGLRGPPGPQGRRGMKGDDGKVGERGLRGLRGPPGPPGNSEKIITIDPSSNSKNNKINYDDMMLADNNNIESDRKRIIPGLEIHGTNIGLSEKKPLSKLHVNGNIQNNGDLKTNGVMLRYEDNYKNALINNNDNIIYLNYNNEFEKGVKIGNDILIRENTLNTKNINSNGDILVGNNLNVSEESTFNGIINNGEFLNKENINADKNLFVKDSINSSNIYNTGSLLNYGDVNIEGKLNVKNHLSAYNITNDGMLVNKGDIESHSSIYADEKILSKDIIADEKICIKDVCLTRDDFMKLFESIQEPEDPKDLISYNKKEAFSLYVDGEIDNMGGPSYFIFDNKDMSDKNGIVTFTANGNINIYGIFIGMGEQGHSGFNIGQDHNHPLYYGGKGGGGQSGERLNFNLQKDETFTVQFDDKTGHSILKTPQKEIKLKVGSSNKGGKGYVQNQRGGNGEPSTGPDVSDIIKTSTKADGTMIFGTQNGAAVLPKRFGGGGGGGTGYHSSNNFGRRAAWGAAGSGSSPGTVEQSEPIRDLRNYGAGGGGTNAPQYNNKPGKRINSAPGGQGGRSGLIIVVESKK